MAAAAARLRCERANSRHAGAKTPRGSTRGGAAGPGEQRPGRHGNGGSQGLGSGTACAVCGAGPRQVRAWATFFSTPTRTRRGTLERRKDHIFLS